MDKNAIGQMSDRDLLDATQRIAHDERQLTAHLIALLGEVDERRLYLEQSCSSLFTYCTQRLHLSEHAAYHRIEAARAARQYPVILDLVVAGALTLTTVALLRPHLTGQNHQSVLGAARQKSKREVEHQIACLAPRPDERPLVRRVSPPMLAKPKSTSEPAPPLLAEGPCATVNPTISSPRPTVTPLAPDRYLFKVTVSAETHARFRRAQDLLRHAIPNGDSAAVLDRALTLLVDHLERSKIAGAVRPRRAKLTEMPAALARRVRSRRIPAALRRAVWSRDNGQCAFIGPQGRCSERGRLEFHHIIPFADRGPSDVGNLSLRCRAHNGWESERWSADDSVR